MGMHCKMIIDFFFLCKSSMRTVFKFESIWRKSCNAIIYRGCRKLIFVYFKTKLYFFLSFFIICCKLNELWCLKSCIFERLAFICVNFEKCFREYCKNDSNNFVWPKQVSFTKPLCNYYSRIDFRIVKSFYHHRFLEVSFNSCCASVFLKKIVFF